jgi:ABC-type transport system involved in cytochrome c biogenesis ATPase subunit
VPFAVESHALTRTFGPLIAVDSLAISVASGEVFGLLGPNGAGKTTVLKILTTLLRPTSGTATVAGADIVRHPLAVRRAIGYVPQLLSADGTLTGRENLLIFAKLYGMPRRERKVEVPAALAFMGLDGAADRLVRQYSGGMIRRPEIAEAMLGVIGAVVLGAALFSTFSLIVACILKTRERFMGIGQVLTMPLFFASNAIYPISIMPPWLRAIALGNPLTYEVDALRTLMLDGQKSTYGLGVDFAVLAGVTALLIFVAGRLYPRVAT